MVIKYSHKSRHATYIGFALSLLTCPGLITITSCENIYVSPLPNESCPAEPCLTISQLAANTSNYLDSNSIVTILPGNHSLYYKLVIENVSMLTIIANSAPALRATVTCTNCTGFVFKNIFQLHISGLEMFGCGGSRIESVDQFKFENCTVFGQNKNCGSGLSLINSNARLIHSSFKSNMYGSEQTLQYLCIRNYSCKGYGGGAVFAIQSNINVFSCTFEGNRAESGGAMFGKLGSNITIIKSNFMKNQACSGGALYCESGCRVSVYSSIFHENSADNDGGVFKLIMSKLFATENDFKWNRAERDGGVLSTLRTNVNINESTFGHNQAQFGGVMSSENSNSVDIHGSNFTENRVHCLGGVMHLEGIIIANINKGFFFNNFANKKGGVIHASAANVNVKSSVLMNNMAGRGGVFALRGCKISMNQCEFFSNEAAYGGAMYADESAMISASIFVNSDVNCYRRDVRSNSTVMVEINECKYTNNTAHQDGGAIWVEVRNAFININCSSFALNKGHIGGVIHTHSNVNISQSNFTNNEAGSGCVLDVNNYVTITTYGSVIINNNKAGLGLIFLANSIAVFSGNITYTNNIGSIYIIRSNVTFNGRCVFVNCSSLRSYETYHEAGAITLFENSHVRLFGVCILSKNHAQNGGAVYVVRSTLSIYAGNTTIINNEALDTGGGVFLYESKFYCDTRYLLNNTWINISNNSAANRGGGVHAISSSIKIGEVRVNFFPSSVYVYLVANRAKKGGGISLEANTRLILYLETSSLFMLNNNSANFGGGIYVSDDTIAGTCSNTSYEVYTECFMEALLQNEALSNTTTTISLNGNFAQISGHNLHGGLLDRCIKSWIPMSIGVVTADVPFILQNISDVSTDTIGSDPLRVCFCTEGKPDCSYKPPVIQVKKGHAFTVSLVAVDQVHHTKNYVPIHSYLSSTESELAKGQLTQITKESCSNLTFTVKSPHNREELILYAGGPCKDARPSQGRLTIILLPCECPTGFQEIVTNISCECACDSNLFPYITDCDPGTKRLIREGDFWITNTTGSNWGDYLIFPHCPPDYCTRSKVLVNLNIPNGADIQCVNNHHGKLCGACQPYFSLSMGTSSCIKCPKYWPALFAAIIVLSILTGIALVALLLVLNLTVGIGTLNGLIFYANIIEANRGTFFSTSNFVTILIAWLNLELGFDACLFEGMDSYSKTWLQLVFPAYVFILVIIVIFISERYTKFARLISRKNPVATLATLVLLSYTKILRTIIAALSFAIPESSHEIVWLPDARVGYLNGKHIPLFIVSVFILLAGVTYTFVLFCWQWLLHHQNKMIFRWVRNQRLNLFIEPYLAPYTFKHRYWTGLLLLVRVVLYLFTVSVSTVVHEPARWNLLMIIIVVTCLLLPKILLGVREYKKLSIDALESLSYLNILLFCIAKLFTKVEGNEQSAIAYISGLTFVLLLILVILYHIFTELISKTEIWRKLSNKKITQQLIVSTDSMNDEAQKEVAPTSSVVEKPPPGEIPLSAMVERNVNIKTKGDEKRKAAKHRLIRRHHSLTSAVPYHLMINSKSETS